VRDGRDDDADDQRVGAFADEVRGRGRDQQQGQQGRADLVPQDRQQAGPDVLVALGIDTSYARRESSTRPTSRSPDMPQDQRAQHTERWTDPAAAAAGRLG
jgi:hypothetical protein